MQLAADLIPDRDRGDHVLAARSRALADGERGLGERRQDVLARAGLVQVRLGRELGVRTGGDRARDERPVP